MSMTQRPARVELEEDIIINVLACEQDPMLADANLAARTIDVSEGGMKVWLYVPVPQQTRVSVRVPGAEDLSLEGEVRWVEEDGNVRVGVLIDEASEDYAAWRARIESSLGTASRVIH